MSVVAAKKQRNKIFIVADSQENFGESTKKNIRGVKLRKVSDHVYIGCAGNGHIISLLYAFSERHPMDDITESVQLAEYFQAFNKWVKSLIEDFTDEISVVASCQYLIVIKDNVWEFMNFYIRKLEIGEISAIGAGSDSLLSCMLLTDSLEEGIKAVCEHNIHCSEPLDSIEIDIKKYKNNE